MVLAGRSIVAQVKIGTSVTSRIGGNGPNYPKLLLVRR
jgi:hypothetical protein